MTNVPGRAGPPQGGTAPTPAPAREAAPPPAWEFGLVYPEGWVELLLEEGHARPDRAHAAVAAKVDAAYAATVDDDARPVVTTLVAAVMADDAAGGAVVGAHKYLHDDEHGEVHAHLNVRIVARQHPESLEREIAFLAGLGRNPDGALEPPSIDEVDIEGVGRGVRIAFLEAEAVGGPPVPPTAGEPAYALGEDGRVTMGGGAGQGDLDEAWPEGVGSIVIEALTYLVPVPGTAECLWLRFWTPNLSLSERLLDEFDAMAASLTVYRTG